MAKGITNRTDWLRASAMFSAAHQQLEDELARLREKKVAQEFIDKKDAQIEALVNFYNQTDELIQLLTLQLAACKMENHFLTEMLARKISIEELMQYKPTRAVQIFNQQSGESHNVSELNG